MLAGLSLEFINWPTGPEIRTTTDVAPETIVNLGILAGPFIGLLGFLSLWFFAQYRLTPMRHKKILAIIEARGLSHLNDVKNS